jgi:TRAP-type mannitol/chloroaromatic compound transport system permease small subunit
MTETEFRDHPAIDWLNKLARRIADASSVMACMVLLWLVALTCVDVVGRYFFNSPLIGATELVQMSMAGIIFFSMPAMSPGVLANMHCARSKMATKPYISKFLSI